MHSHDQHYKTLLKTFLRELLLITHPNLAQSLVFESCRFLDKETWTDLLAGKGYRMDLVCEINTTDGELRIFVILIEIEERNRRSRMPMGQRMANYFMSLTLRHQKPVLPILVSFAPGSRGLTTEIYKLSILKEKVYSLHYRTLGVRGLPALSFLSKGNPLGWALAVRMDRGKLSKVDLRLACERKIVHADLDESKQLLLLNSVRTYTSLTPLEQREYTSKLAKKENRSVKEKTMTWLEKVEAAAEKRGEKRGEKRAMARGYLDSIQEAWVIKYGPMPEDLQRMLSTQTDPAKLKTAIGVVLLCKTATEARKELEQIYLRGLRSPQPSR